jgi:hypothetical protein
MGLACARGHAPIRAPLTSNDLTAFFSVRDISFKEKVSEYGLSYDSLRIYRVNKQPAGVGRPAAPLQTKEEPIT